MRTNYLIFKNLDNALNAAKNTGRRFEIKKRLYDFGETIYIYVYDDAGDLTDSFTICEKLHALVSYQEQGD